MRRMLWPALLAILVLAESASAQTPSAAAPATSPSTSIASLLAHLARVALRDGYVSEGQFNRRVCACDGKLALSSREFRDEGGDLLQTLTRKRPTAWAILNSKEGHR